MSCFADKHLDGNSVENIDTDLSQSTGMDSSRVKVLRSNLNISFLGVAKVGPFDISGELAREFITQSYNPNNRPNSEVVKPWVNGRDIMNRPSDHWIIDFGCYTTQEEAALYEKPFEYVKQHVKPIRENHSEKKIREEWWLFKRFSPALRQSIKDLDRYIITPQVSKHRAFKWITHPIIGNNATIAIARNDDTFFGVLHSKIHHLWVLRLGSTLEDRPCYTPSTTFETFPFPEGLTPDIPAAQYAKDPRAMKIAAIAKELDEMRENWLNPPELVKIVPEVATGYPDRILPVNAEAEKELKKRTMTNLYNQMPDWLRDIHNRLDVAVLESYGMPINFTDAEILNFLFDLNQARGL